MSPSTATSSDRRAEWITAALAMLGLGALCPLGLASGQIVDLAASAFGVHRPLTEATPLADVLTRVAVLLPLGEVGARPHAVAAFGGAVGLALLVARVRLTARSSLPAAVAAGVLVVAVSRPFLEVATVRADAALDFALLAGIALLLESLRREPTRPSVGLGLALACGLAAGASWPVRVSAWPLAAALTVWALRGGQRWPLLAPTTFVAGSGVVIGAVVSATAVPSATVGTLFRHIILLSWQGASASATARAALVSTADDVGVLALLVAAIGCGLLLVRARVETMLWMLLWVGAAVASFAGGDGALGRLVLVVALAVPIASAIGALAQALGRARVAAAIVMTVIIALPPAVAGAGAARVAARRASPGALARRLDVAAARLGTGVDALASTQTRTNTDADRWLRYVRAIDGRLDRSGGLGRWDH